MVTSSILKIDNTTIPLSNVLVCILWAERGGWCAPHPVGYLGFDSRSVLFLLAKIQFAFPFGVFETFFTLGRFKFD